MFALLIALVLAVTAPVAADAMPNADPSDDPYLWLEDVDGERALDWVRARNDETAAVLQTSAFDTLEKRLLGILDSDARIPYVEKLGPWYYNFWTDAKNPRGLASYDVRRVRQAGARLGNRARSGRARRRRA